MTKHIVAAVLLALVERSSSGQTADRNAAGAAKEADNCSNSVLQIGLRALPTPLGIRRPLDPIPVPVWSGLLEIRLKNISTLMVDVGERSTHWEYAFTVSDQDGRPTSMTEYGKNLQPGQDTPEAPYVGPNASFDLSPAQEFKTEVYLTQLYKITPGQAYTIRVRRAWGLPKVDQAGRAIERPQLNCSLVVPAGPLVVQQ